jgi:hypothetical protein
MIGLVTRNRISRSDYFEPRPSKAQLIIPVIARWLRIPIASR